MLLNDENGRRDKNRQNFFTVTLIIGKKSEVSGYVWTARKQKILYEYKKAESTLYANT